MEIDIDDCNPARGLWPAALHLGVQVFHYRCRIPRCAAYLGDFGHHGILFTPGAKYLVSSMQTHTTVWGRINAGNLPARTPGAGGARNYSTLWRLSSPR